MKKITFVLIALFLVSAFAFGVSLNTQTVMSTATVEAINAQNSQLGLPWKAGLNDFSGRTIEQLSVMNGWRPLPKDFVNAILSKAKKLTTTDDMLMGSYTMFNPLTMDASNLRTAYDLSNQFVQYPGISYVTPVKDQGYHGTCWAFSTTETFETALAMQGVVPYSNIPVLSTQFVAYHDIDWNLLIAANGWVIQDSNFDAGGNQYFSMYNAIRYGIPPATDFPTISYENSPWIEWDPQNPNWQKDLIYSQGTLLLLSAPEEAYYYNVSYNQYIDAIKTMIMKYGSVSVSYSVPADFFGYQSGVYVPVNPGSSSNPYEGGHAVQIVGWIDNYVASNGQTYNVWIVRNSWGSSWGMNGYWLQPWVTPQEYASGNVPAWKFESYGNWFFVPIFKTNNTVWSAADFNNDGYVNMTDWNMLVNAMQQTNPSSQTIAKYDIGVPKTGKIGGGSLEQFMYLWNLAAQSGH
ncbi:MAG TPA: hypothetical protein ENO32_08330 [Mesoaciditoga lauensis]|nr:hypothetical protein [Mesoaciditoga lauensis]